MEVEISLEKGSWVEMNNQTPWLDVVVLLR
jgi:hypothetical protein